MANPVSELDLTLQHVVRLFTHGDGASVFCLVQRLERIGLTVGLDRLIVFCALWERSVALPGHWPLTVEEVRIYGADRPLECISERYWPHGANADGKRRFTTDYPVSQRHKMILAVCWAYGLTVPPDAEERFRSWGLYSDHRPAPEPDSADEGPIPPLPTEVPQ